MSDLRQAIGEARRHGVRRSIPRVVRSVRRHGVIRAARRVRHVGEPFWWHRLDVAARVARPVPDGLELTRRRGDGLDLYAQIGPADNVHDAAGWFAQGAELWMMVAGERTAFACWIFHRRLPMGAAPDGSLALPDGVAFLEFSVTSPDFRGLGVAPAAWSGIAEALAADGVRTIVTKVNESNTATHRALAKAGFARAERDDPIARDFERQVGR